MFRKRSNCKPSTSLKIPPRALRIYAMLFLDVSHISIEFASIQLGDVILNTQAVKDPPVTAKSIVVELAALDVVHNFWRGHMQGGVFSVA